MTDAVSVMTNQTYCGHCGEPVTDGPHPACEHKLELEPPRFCPLCRRRMVVQVIPGEWTARCSVHGETTRPTWS